MEALAPEVKRNLDQACGHIAKPIKLAHSEGAKRNGLLAYPAETHRRGRDVSTGTCSA